MSEKDLQSQLTNARIARTSNTSKTRGGQTASWTPKISMIKDIKVLDPKLNLISFSERKILEETHIPCPRIGTPQGALAYVAERAYFRKPECTPIKEAYTRCLRRAAATGAFNKTTEKHAAIAPQSRLRPVLACHDSKRTA